MATQNNGKFVIIEVGKKHGQRAERAKQAGKTFPNGVTVELVSGMPIVVCQKSLEKAVKAWICRGVKPNLAATG